MGGAEGADSMSTVTHTPMPCRSYRRYDVPGAPWRFYLEVPFRSATTGLVFDDMILCGVCDDFGDLVVVRIVQ